MPEDPQSFMARILRLATEHGASSPLGAHLATGSANDRHEPAAAEWVRRWRPARAAAPLPSCACAAGRCGICN
jgi:hypothetical protein